MFIINPRITIYTPFDIPLFYLSKVWNCELHLQRPQSAFFHNHYFSFWSLFFLELSRSMLSISSGSSCSPSLLLLDSACRRGCCLVLSIWYIGCQWIACRFSGPGVLHQNSRICCSSSWGPQLIQNPMLYRIWWGFRSSFPTSLSFAFDSSNWYHHLLERPFWELTVTFCWHTWTYQVPAHHSVFSWRISQIR